MTALAYFNRLNEVRSTPPVYMLSPIKISVSRDHWDTLCKREAAIPGTEAYEFLDGVKMLDPKLHAEFLDELHDLMQSDND